MFYICEDITLAHSVTDFSLYPKTFLFTNLTMGIISNFSWTEAYGCGQSECVLELGYYHQIANNNVQPLEASISPCLEYS